MGEAEQNKWDLMAKVLADEASNSEKDVLETWKNLDSDNKAMFDAAEKDWYALEFQKRKDTISVDSAWEKQLDKIKKGAGNSKAEKTRKISFSFLRIAASILIVVGFSITGLFIYKNLTSNMLTVSTNMSESKTVVLPDGSEVTLNDNSTLSFPRKFSEGTREVQLNGEAFFDIKRNEAMPFIIHTDDADVKVLGTSFNVNTTLEKDLVEVFVYTGVVQLLDGKNPDYNIIIEEGEIGRFENKVMEKVNNADKNYIAWKTKELFFKDSNLSDIAKTLSKVYDVKIELSTPNIGECLYSSTNSTFVKEDLKDILNIICTTFNLEFEKTNNSYVIKGSGC